MTAAVSLTPEAAALLNSLAASTKAAAGTTPGTPLHGPGGLLGYPGLNRRVINRYILPRSLAAELPARMSTDANALIPILTGQLASTGSENTTACADSKVVGALKRIALTYPFGRFSRHSQVLQLDRVGMIINRGEFTDNVLFGQPVTESGDLPSPVNWSRAVASEVEKKLAELYAGFFRDFAPLVFSGNPTNTAGNTGYQEYAGLDLIINTGKRDAISGVAAPAADSIVYNFNGTSANTSSATVVSVITNVIRNLKLLADRAGLGEVEWALVMREGAFYVLSDVWPCAYLTTNCAAASTSAPNMINAADQVKMRDEMRNGQYLMVDGAKIRVIIDDTITETVPGAVGTYRSSLYLVPLRAGGTPLTYMEWFPMNQEAIAAANAMAPSGSYRVLGGGRYLLHLQPPSNECVQARLTALERLVVEAPFLAARLTNLNYTYLIHEVESLTTQPYFANGGQTASPLPYFYPSYLP